MVRSDNLDSYIFYLCWCSWNAKFVDILEFAKPHNWQLDVYFTCCSAPQACCMLGWTYWFTYALPFL
jgi:hypothetical protein